MENNLHNDFENFIRREIGGVEPSPSENTWAQIAAQQSRKNRWLKARYYGKYAIPVAATVLLAVSIFLWRPSSPMNNSTASNGIAMPPEHGYLASESLQPKAPGAAITDWANATDPQTSKPRYVNSFPAWYKVNNVPVDRVRFIAEKGVQYQSPVSGNTVTIPANSLVHADGTPVSGNVELLFREYRDIPDILAGDIPMHYTDPRGRFFFNSGGMFDVRVNQNNEELFMAPGQVYDVDFKANKNLSNASLFYFDEQKNNWDYVSGEAFDDDAKEIRTFDVRTVNEANQKLPVISNESTVAKENMKGLEDEACLPVLPNYPEDADQIQWVKDAIKLGNDLTYGKRTIPKWFKVNPKGTDAYFAFAIDRTEIQLVYGVDKALRFFPQDINGVFTELNALKNCYFVRTSDTLSAVQQQEGSSNVDAIFHNTALWSSVEVQKDAGDKCFLVLRQMKGDVIRIHARICASTEDGKDVNFNPDAVLTEYARLREQRLANMSQELKEFRKFMTVSTMFQPENEWCMRQKDWLNYFEANNGLMRARYDALIKEGMLSNDQLVQSRLDAWAAKSRALVFGKLNRGAGKMNTGQQLTSLLKLAGFGMYNCDQIYRFGFSVSFYLAPASFFTPEGTPIVASSVSILDEPTRMFFTMEKPDKIYIMPTRKLEVMVKSTDGKIYYVSGSAYSQTDFSNKNRVNFVAQEITDQVQSPQGWADLLRI